MDKNLVLSAALQIGFPRMCCSAAYLRDSAICLRGSATSMFCLCEKMPALSPSGRQDQQDDYEGQPREDQT